MVDWLYSRVEGFKDRRDARKYASSLLKHGYLRHTVNKITFSEQCYYTFGDLCQSTHTSHSVSIMQLHMFGCYMNRRIVLSHFLSGSAFSPIRHGITQFKRGIQWWRLRAGHSSTAPAYQQPLASGRAAISLPCLSLCASQLPTRILRPVPQFPQWECRQPAQRG